MASTPNYNDQILAHIQNIDEERLDDLLNKVTEITRLYKKQSNAKDSTADLLEENRRIRSQFESFAKKQNEFNQNRLTFDKENEKAQQKALENIKHVSEFTSRQSAGIIDVAKKLESYEKTTSEKLKEQSSILKQGNEDYLSTQKKQERLALKVRKENEKKSVQEKLQIDFEHKAFRFQSEYYKNARKQIDFLARGLKDFKNNPRAFVLDAMGVVMGKAFDKSIQALTNSLKSIAKGITDGLKDSFDSFFNAIESSRESSEDIAKSTGRSFQVSQKSLDQVQSITFQLMKKGDTTAQYASDYQKEIAEFLQKNYGEGWMNKLTPAQIEETIKRTGIALTNGIDIKEIARYNNKIEDLLNVLTYETDLKGALTRLPEKIESTVEAGLIDINDRNLRLTKQQAIDINKSLGLFNAQMAENNDDFNERASGAIKDMVSSIAQMTDISAILSEDQIRAAQGYGVDLKYIQKAIQSGSDEERIKAIRMIGKNAANEHLAPIFEELGLMHGGQAEVLKNMKFEGSDYIKSEWLKDATKEGAVGYKSEVSLMKQERDMFFKALVATRQEAENEGKEVSNTALLISGIQRILTKQEEELIGKLSYEQYDKVIKLAQSGGSKDGLSKGEQNLFDLLTKSKEGENSKLQKATELLKDMGTIAEQATIMNNLGLDKALASGGVNGLLGKIFELSTGAAFSDTQKEQITKFLKGIGKTLEPMFNVLKDILIMPILDSLQNTVGTLLGEILVGVKGIWSNLTKSKYSDEEKYIDRTRFLKSTDVLKDMADIDKGDLSEGIYSEDYRKAIKNIDSLSMSDVDKYNLTTAESIGLKNYIARNSKAMNTNGMVLGATKINDIDLSTTENRNQLGNALSKIKVNLNEGKEGFNEEARSLEEVLQNSTSIWGTDAYKILRFLASDPSIDYKTLEDTYETLEEHAVGLYDIRKSLGIENLKEEKALRAYTAYMLLKSNSDILTDETGRYRINSIVPHNNEATYHYQLLKRNSDNVEYYAKGGVVEKQKGGTHAILGEAGYDEIVIPTDPNKNAYAQKLLQIAKDKYNLYLKDPDNVSEKLATYVSILGRSARMLMLQLDPLKDVMAYNYITQAFSMLGMIGRQKLQNSLTATTSGASEEITGGGLPIKGAPIENAPNIGSIRSAIIEEAKRYIGTPYAEAPNGFVCNELVNAAYGTILGAKNYKELLNNAGYNHDRLHTISGFINEMGKNGFKGKLASSVPYAELSGLAKPADLVFSSNTGKTPSSYNPDNHGHVNLYIDSDSKIDSTSMKVKGKDGVGIHKPGNGPHMLFNILDLMPEAWYIEKGLIKPGEIIGTNADGSPIYANSDFNPSLQSIPESSSVSSHVSRAEQARHENARIRAQEKLDSIIEKILKTEVNITKAQQMTLLQSIDSVPQSEAFMTVAPHTKSPAGFSYGR